MYNDRIVNCEKAAFTPLVFSTAGGMGKECSKLNKRIAELISKKRNEKYCHTISHVRTRLRFALLKATVVAVRGFRSHGSVVDQDSGVAEDDIPFSMIPYEPAYEGY